MKQRLVSALVAIALFLLTGCRGNFLSDDSGKTTSQGVTFISKQAPLVVSFLTSWTQSQPQVEKALKVFLGKQNLDYKKDIQPWLGSEITLAVTDLDFDHEAGNGVQPGYLLIATTKDEAKSRQFLQTWLAQKLIAGTELAFAPYKGTQLIYPQVVNPENLVDAARSDDVGSNNGGERNPAPSNLASTFASTVVSGRFVLIANHPQVLRQAINNAQAVDLSLANSPSYQQTRGSLDQSGLGWGFINLPAVTAWLGKHGELTQEPPFASLAIALALRSNIALSPQNQGLVAKTALITGNPETSLDNNPDPQVQSPNLISTNPATDYLPASSGLAISGTNLQSFLAKYITTTDESAESRESNLLATGLGSLLEKVDQELQIDFSQDILPWLTGDYALGWLPSQDSGANSGNWLFVTDRTSPQAQTAIAHLDQLAMKQGFSITPLKLAEQPVTLWTQLQTETNKQGLKDVDTLVRGVHAQVGNYEIFASDIGVMGAALGVGSQPLTKNKQFQEAIAPLAIPNQGYIYLDWPTARPWLESQFPLLRFLEVPLEPFLVNLETLSFTNYGAKAGITSSELFFNFQKSE